MDDVEYPYAAQSASIPAQAFGGDQSFDERRATALCGLALIVACFALANTLIYPLSAAASRQGFSLLLLYAAMGGVVAQVAIVPAVLVFAPGPLLVRALGCWLAACGLFGCWLVSIRIDEIWGLFGNHYKSPSVVAHAVWFILLHLPGALVLVPAPLWFLKLYRGWRLVRIADDGRPTAAAPERPLTIRHHLLALTAVAAALGLVRFHELGDATPGSLALMTIVFGVIGATICLVSIRPAMLLLLRGERWRRGLVIFALDVFVLASLPLVIVAFLTWRTTTWPGLDRLAQFYFPFLAWGGAVAGCMMITRLAGYRLVIGRDKRRKA